MRIQCAVAALAKVPGHLGVACSFGLLLCAPSPLAGQTAGPNGDCAFGPDDGYCTAVVVPLDRTRPGGRTIDLNVAVARARSDPPASDPVFFLVGGPGQAATDFAGFVADRYASVRRRRDMVFVDRRGTGRSNPLRCDAAVDPQAVFAGVFPPGSTQSCLDRLDGETNLAAYGTVAAARDLDAVRQALGYERINVIGTSYGTRLALEYVRRFGQRARSVVLRGVVAPDALTPVSYARDAQAAIDALLSDCRADPSCRSAFSDIADEWEAVLARLRRASARVRVLDADSSAHIVSFDSSDFGYAVRGLLYGPAALELPFRIHETFRTRDYTYFAQAYLDRARRISRSFATGLYLSVLCTEDHARISPASASAAASGTFLGDYLISEFDRACAHWNGEPSLHDIHSPVVSDVPALIVSGRRDPSTPPRWGASVAEHLEQSVHVVFPYGGHGFTGAVGGTACAVGIITDFIEQGGTDGLDTGCLDDLEPLPLRVPEAASDGRGHGERVSGNR